MEKGDKCMSKGELEKKDVDEDPDDEQLDETPEDIISILGFDPAKEKEEKETEDSEEGDLLRAKLKKFLKSSTIPTAPAEVLAIPEDPVFQPEEKELHFSNTEGIVYKGYVIKQSKDNTFEVCSIGGGIIEYNIVSLELAMNKINSISIGE
jgi:hypothetical protein